MNNIERTYIRMLYPKGNYSDKLNKLIKKWDNIGFIIGLNKFNTIRLCVIYELFNLKFNTDFSLDTFDFNNTEIVIYPIVRRLITNLKYDKIVDINFIIEYVKSNYPIVLTECFNQSLNEIGLDFEALACLKVSESLLKELNI